MNKEVDGERRRKGKVSGEWVAGSEYSGTFIRQDCKDCNGMKTKLYTFFADRNSFFFTLV